jgi:RimJ/RimL family protein N-acetyltransferase
MTSDVLLRDVTDGDLPIFFEQQLDPTANRMAAFTAEDPADRAAFTAKWAKILGDESITKRTILFGGQVAGSVSAFVAPWSGKLEVTYWIGREFWGKGIATGALAALLRAVKTRPLHARAAKDNLASLRVLEKCAFTIAGYERGFANARGEEVDEVVLELKAEAPEVRAKDAEPDAAADGGRDAGF